MRVLLQRVTQASVSISTEDATGDLWRICGQIGSGFLALVGITHDDTEKDVAVLAEKVLHLRVFDDADGKMNLSLLDIGGEVLAVSQFTLYADARKGRRPSFTAAASPAQALPLYESFVNTLRKAGIPVSTGRFGAHMQVALQNDGPVTVMLESHDGVIL